MIILACAEIGMKIQERMYESSELTTEGTVCEIKKELAFEWECCGWIKKVLASGCTITKMNTVRLKTPVPCHKTSSQITFNLKFVPLTLESVNGLSNYSN